MNRFLDMNRELDELERRRSRNGARPRNAAAAGSPGAGPLATTASTGAAARALVVLIENGGVDLGIGKLVELVLAGAPAWLVVPGWARERIVRFVEEKVRALTDHLLESAELAINGYGAARPRYYGDVQILRNATGLYANLRDTLVRLTREDKIVDLLVLTHGSTDSIATAGGTRITDADIRSIRVHNGNRPVRLRSVYMMSCVGSSLNDDWLAIGAKASAGAIRNNYLPEPTTHFFFRNWKSGQSFNDAVTNAYRSSIAEIGRIIREAVELLASLLGGPGGVLAGRLAGKLADRLADIENREFVKDSAPVIAGDASVEIDSDALSFTQSAVPSMAYTIVPLAGALDRVPRTTTWTISPAGIDFIKSFEGFRSRLYDDPAGHCTIGYGTLVHRGRCNGDPSEARFQSGVTEQEARGLLEQRVLDFERAVNERVTTEMSQSQFDALVSFAYNVGTANFAGSTLLRKLNGGDYDAVPVELRKWVYGGGKKLAGLERRREAEARMFTAGDYSTGESLPGRAFERRPPGLAEPRERGRGEVQLS